MALATRCTNTGLVELHNGGLIHNQCFIQCVFVPRVASTTLSVGVLPGGGRSAVPTDKVALATRGTNAGLVELHNGKLIHNQCFIQCDTMGVDLNIHS